MYSIEQVINIIKESNYFTAWESILISDTCIDEWQLILQNDENEELYNFLADKLYKYNVPYVIVSEYIDEFFRYYENGISRHKIKNKIAQAYLKKKLIDDSNAIDIELNK